MPIHLTFWNGHDFNLFDACLTIGTEKTIKEVINAPKEYTFGLKIEDNLTDYLIFKKFQERDKYKVWIMQPHLIDNLLESFGEEFTGMKKITPLFKCLVSNL
jgi:hypothetical protein